VNYFDGFVRSVGIHLDLHHNGAAARNRRSRRVALMQQLGRRELFCVLGQRRSGDESDQDRGGGRSDPNESLHDVPQDERRGLGVRLGTRRALRRPAIPLQRGKFSRSERPDLSGGERSET
jgi:hypothetical protein